MVHESEVEGPFVADAWQLVARGDLFQGGPLPAMAVRDYDQLIPLAKRGQDCLKASGELTGIAGAYDHRDPTVTRARRQNGSLHRTWSLQRLTLGVP
jgi:hypothetical protein